MIMWSVVGSVSKLERLCGMFCSNKETNKDNWWTSCVYDCNRRVPSAKDWLETELNKSETERGPERSCRISTRYKVHKLHQKYIIFEDVPLVEFMCLVFTRMPGESYRRRLRPLLLNLLRTSNANYLPCVLILETERVSMEEERDVEQRMKSIVLRSEPLFGHKRKHPYGLNSGHWQSPSESYQKTSTERTLPEERHVERLTEVCGREYASRCGASSGSDSVIHPDLSALSPQQYNTKSTNTPKHFN